MPAEAYKLDVPNLDEIFNPNRFNMGQIKNTFTHVYDQLICINERLNQNEKDKESV